MTCNDQLQGTPAYGEEDRSLEAAGARVSAALWGTLARGLLRPTVELAADVRSGAYASALADLIDEAASPLLAQALGVLRDYAAALQESGRTNDELRLDLEVDYNRLFVGPGKLLAPPYESFYASEAMGGEGGRLRTQEEFAVKVAYAANGYAMPEQFVDLPDHAAIELDFLALMARDEANAWDAGDVERALYLQREADAFAAQHPATWFATCADRVDAGARTPLYPAIMRIACVMLGV